MTTETLEVEVWQEDEPAHCADCGDEIEPGHQVCWEPMREFHPQAVGTVHPWCAVRNGYLIDKPVVRP